jgi:hypothetical protein
MEVTNPLKIVLSLAFLSFIFGSLKAQSPENTINRKAAKHYTYCSLCFKRRITAFKNCTE